jgi:hypothetical protein
LALAHSDTMMVELLQYVASFTGRKFVAVLLAQMLPVTRHC